MKIAIVLAEGEKQIMMTPETDHEREALKFISPEDTLNVVSKWSTFDNKPSHFAETVLLSQGGTYRRYATEDSLMFVIKKTKPK
jgi:hypothetical protein